MRSAPKGLRRSTLLLASIALAAAALVPEQVAAQAAASSKDPAAMEALDRMGKYLQSLTAFQVTSTIQNEDVLENGMKTQHSGTTDLIARRPNGLRIDVTTDRHQRQLLYNGKEFTMWAPRTRFYATVPAPPTIAELADTLSSKFDIELPLVDLFRWGSTPDSGKNITAAMDLGRASVDGTSCSHYGFRQDGVDWQVWIQEGGYPLPRKVVITTTSDDARPQYQATYSWTLAPSYGDSAFTFTPPRDSFQIKLNERPADAAGQ